MIRVTAQKLRETQQQLRGMNEQLKARAEDFTASGANLLSKWDGDAKTIMEANFKNDRTQMDNFIILINEYCNVLEDQAIRYESAESQNVLQASERSYK